MPNGSGVPQSLRRKIFARDRYTCQRCGLTGREERFPKGGFGYPTTLKDVFLSIDHILPKSRGGTHLPEIGVGAASREAVNSGLVDVLSEWAGFLPLELCPGINAFAELKPWARAKLKKAAYRMLLTQHGMRRRAEPLQGRPIVICTRFSSVEPDAHSGWSKALH